MRFNKQQSIQDPNPVSGLTFILLYSNQLSKILIISTRKFIIILGLTLRLKLFYGLEIINFKMIFRLPLQSVPDSVPVVTMPKETLNQTVTLS